MKRIEELAQAYVKEDITAKHLMSIQDAQVTLAASAFQAGFRKGREMAANKIASVDTHSGPTYALWIRKLGEEQVGDQSSVLNGS